MTSARRILGGAFFLALVLLVVESQETPRWRQSQNHRLEGPIHTQLDITRKLQPDPRGKDHTLPLREGRAWLAFDSNGQVTEDGTVDESGNITTLVRRKYDSARRETESVLTDAGKTTRYRVERDKDSAEEQDVRTFADGKLLSRIVSSSDPGSGSGESKVFNGEGELIHHSIDHRDVHIQEQRATGREGKFLIHALVRYDDDRNMIESTLYDAQGRVVSDLSLKDGVLTSWWQDPKCDCTNVAGFGRAGDSTVFYMTTKEGILRKTVQHHKGRRTNSEIDDEELYDENDHLLERIAYIYERDSHGNWTKRTSLILDIKTNNMVPVREDTRVLTYY